MKKYKHPNGMKIIQEPKANATLSTTHVYTEAELLYMLADNLTAIKKLKVSVKNIRKLLDGKD